MCRYRIEYNYCELQLTIANLLLVFFSFVNVLFLSMFCFLLPALDLQSCGVTTEAAKLFIEVLKFNSCLMVLDVRANALVDDDVIDVIHEQLMINVSGMDKSEEVYTCTHIESPLFWHNNYNLCL